MYCTSERMSVGQLFVERRRINLSPKYQRESGAWSLQKKQLFIDSILNKFDIPKFYVHDLRNSGGDFQLAVVDGKQRLSTIWDFMSDDPNAKFPLAEDFSFYDNSLQSMPCGGMFYRDFNEEWKERFKAAALDVVLIQNADEQDIEELFSRLNNGEPLNAAEKRNAMGGEMCEVIREISKDPFFIKKLSFPNKRYSYLEQSAKLIRLELLDMKENIIFGDVKKKNLDDLVKNNKIITPEISGKLKSRIQSELKNLSRIFNDSDDLLSRASYPQLYYVWIKQMNRFYAHEIMNARIKTFLDNFTTKRVLNNQKPEDERDSQLVEFGRLAQQGTNDSSSMQNRADILTERFLAEFPDTRIRDARRSFHEAERRAIWILGGKKCAKCSKILSLDEMHADHVTPWSAGGETSFSNAQCLCSEHNLKKGASV